MNEGYKCQKIKRPLKGNTKEYLSDFVKNDFFKKTERANRKRENL